jgi:biopolymer transport protein ExbB
VIVLLGLSIAAIPLWSRAQEAAEQAQPAEAVVAEPAASPQEIAAPAKGASKPPAEPTIWDLTVQGGIFMIPLFIDSIIVLAYAIERHFGLRGKKILPPKLLLAIQQLNSEENGIDPRQAYQICQQHPSPLANVIRAAILKIGRPHSELEQAVQDAVGREADEMSVNLRPINVSVSVAPLIGLLGTVQGMILAFMVTSTTTASGAA